MSDERISGGVMCLALMSNFPVKFLGAFFSKHEAQMNNIVKKESKKLT